MISIIVPTYDRYECLADTLKDIKAQKGSAKEVLVIDQTPIEKRQRLEEQGLSLTLL